MAAFTTMALIGSAALGAASTVYSVKQQKDAAKDQKAQMAAQETAAKETAALEAVVEDTGADIRLGRDDSTETTGTAAGAGGGSNRTGAVSSRVGGLGVLSGNTRKRKVAGL